MLKKEFFRGLVVVACHTEIINLLGGLELSLMMLITIMTITKMMMIMIMTKDHDHDNGNDKWMKRVV